MERKMRLLIVTLESEKSLQGLFLVRDNFGFLLRYFFPECATASDI